MTSEISNLDYLALKEEGNALYSAGDFPAAVKKYNKCLKLCTDKNTDRSTLLKNRAAAYLKLRDYQKVVEDTTAALEIVQSDIKALYRRCQAYEQLGKYNEALEDARAVNRLNPQNSAIQPYLRKLQEIVNESNGDALDINSLPDEIILKIFSYLKQNQLGQIARVCKRWDMLTKDPVLWKRVNVTFSPSKKSQIIIVKSFINRLPSSVKSIRLDFEELEEFVEYEEYEEHEDCILLNFVELCMKLQEKCPHLEELILYNCKLSNSLPSAIDVCAQFLQDVKNLVFHRCIFPCFIFSRYPARKEFGGTSKIEVLYLSGCNLGRFNKPQFSKMPYLKVLCLYDTNIDNSWFNEDASFLNQLNVLYLGFNPGYIFTTLPEIQNHALNLKELYLCSVNVDDYDFYVNNSVFPYLKTICLSGSDVTCKGVVFLIQSCPSLENVYVNRDVAEYFAAHPFVVANKCKAGIVKAIVLTHKHNVDYLHT